MNYLYEFPGQQLPSTWEHNERFLHIIKQQQERWKEQGYYWKFGLEIDFDLMVGSELPSADEKYMDVDYSKETGIVYDPEYYQEIIDRNPDLANYKHPEKGFAGVREKLEGILAKIFEDIRTGLIDIDGISEENSVTKEEIFEELQRYGKELYDDNFQIREYAAKNIFMARIHMYDSDQGGVRDLIEPRFGDAPWGLGWWDKPDDAEIRIPVTENPLEIIGRYHQAVTLMKKLQDETDILVHFDTAVHPQLHTSIWRISDDKNMTEANDEDSAAFCEKAANGLIRAIQEAPVVFQEYNEVNKEQIFKGSFGTTRSDEIRQRKTDWEFRLPVWGMTGHLARHIALIMGSTANGVFNPETYKDWDQKHLTSVNTKPALALSHKFGKPLSGLRTTLSHCTIDDNGYLRSPDRMTVEYNMGRMIDEIGEENTGLFKSSPDLFEAEYDLSHADGWMALIKSIKITDDNQFDFGDIDPEIAAGLDCLSIDGRRYIMHGRAFINADNKNRLENYFPFIEQSPSLRSFMPADLLTDLRGTYEGIYNKAHENRAKSFATRLRLHFQAVAELHDNPGDIKPEDLPELSDKTIKDIIKNHARAGLLDDCIHEEVMREVEAMEAYERHITEGDLNRGEMYDYTHMKHLRPYFEAAVKDAVETQRHAPKADNWSVHAMQSAAEFMERDIIDISNYDIDHFSSTFDGWVHVIHQEKIDVVGMKMMELGSSTFIAGFAGMVLRDESVSLEDIKDMFQRSRIRVAKLLDEKCEEHAEAIAEIAQRPDFKSESGDVNILRDLGEHILDSYDHVITEIGRMYEGPRKETVISPPWHP